jgi:flagellar export protein FliJ
MTIMTPFKLQSVLNYRQTLCNVAQQELCKTLEEETSLISTIKDEQLALDNLYVELDTRQKNGIKSHELAMYESRCWQKTEGINNLEQKLLAIRKIIIAQRQNLCETDRDKKVLVRLKEKQTAVYTSAQRKKENSALDEIAIQRHGR